MRHSHLAGLAAAAAMLTVGAGMAANVKPREERPEPEPDMRSVPGSRQRKRWLERQARKRQRQQLRK